MFIEYNTEEGNVFQSINYYKKTSFLTQIWQNCNNDLFILSNIEDFVSMQIVYFTCMVLKL